MRVVINGREQDVRDGATIVDVLATLALTTKRVAVELNERVVPRAEHAHTSLAPNDQLEIVTFVGGG